MKSMLGRFALTMSLVLAFVLAGCATHNTSIGTKMEDTAITAKVKAALFADPDVKGQQVAVDTVDGVVQLSGFVSSSAMAARAVDIARRTDGVRRVENKVSVR